MYAAADIHQQRASNSQSIIREEMPEMQIYCDLLSFLFYSPTHQNVPVIISDHQLGGFVVAGVEEGVAVGGEGGVGQLAGYRF